MAGKAKEVKTISNDPLELVRKKMEEKFGKGIIVSGTSKTDVKTVPTGSYRLDKVTDCGGIPIGKLVEMFGPESSGKSTLSLHIIKEFQQKFPERKCLLMDYEYSFDKKYAIQIGVDVDALLIAQPDTMEDGYNIIYEYIKTDKISLVVIDSHTAMVPVDRLEGQVGDAKMAPEARINSVGLKKVKPELEKHHCTLLGISQLRADIGGMGNTGAKPTGGNAWKFYTDMRIKVYKIVDKVNETNKTTIEIIKNKCGRPFGKCEVGIAWGEGIDTLGEILDIAVEYNVIKKSGSWYAYGDSKLGQGASSVKDLFISNNEFFEEIKEKTLTAYNSVKLVIENVEPTEEEKQIAEENEKPPFADVVRPASELQTEPEQKEENHE